jgi:phage baseplate assembly protein W
MGKTIIQTAISLPFTISAYGTVTSSNNMSKIWADRVRALVGTAIKERIMFPEYGSTIPLSFMENVTDAKSIIIDEVNRIFPVYLPLLTVTDVSVTFDQSTGALTAVITYKLPDGTPGVDAIAVASIDQNGLVSESGN